MGPNCKKNISFITHICILIDLNSLNIIGTLIQTCIHTVVMK